MFKVLDLKFKVSSSKALIKLRKSRFKELLATSYELLVIGELCGMVNVGADRCVCPYIVLLLIRAGEPRLYRC